MKLRWKRFLLGGGALLATTIAAAHWQGFRLNTDTSLDGRVWRIFPGENLNRGDYAVICFPRDFVAKHRLDANFPVLGDVRWKQCGGIPRFLKLIMAVEGDVYRVDDLGVWINGQLINNTARLFVPAEFPGSESGKVARGEYLVLGTSPYSLDSRYFGPISEKWTYARAERIF